MSRVVSIDLDVNDAKAVRAWQRARDSIAEFDKQGQKTGKTFGSMLTDQVKGVTAMAAGFAGVGSVIGGIVTAAGLLRAEYDNLIQRQEKAANIQLPLADLERQLSANMGGNQNAPLAQKIAMQEDVLKERDRIVKVARTTPAQATSAFSNALSARGEASVQQAADAVIAAIGVAPDADAIDFLAGGALDLSKGGADPATAANWLAASGAELRLTKTSKIAKSVANAVNSGSGFGNDERLSLAMFSYMAGAANDTEGEPSTTALISLQKQLRNAVPEASNSMAAAEMLAADPKRQQEFLSGINAEGRFLIPYERLIKDPSVRQQIYDIRDRIPTFEKADQLAADQRALLSALPTSAIRNVDRGVDSITQGIQAGDVTAVSSILRNKIPDLKQAYGASSLATKFEALATELDSTAGSNPLAGLDSVARQLGAAEADFRDGTPGTPARVVQSGFGSTFVPGTPGRPATNRDIEIADALRELITIMKEERLKLAGQVEKQNAPAVQVNVNNRPANADVRKIPAGGRHADLSAPPSPSRVSRTGGN